MPIYEFTCLKCGDAFELLVRGSSQPECPSCHTTRVERRMSLPARPLGSSGQKPDFSSLGPPKGGGGGCGSGSCGCH